MKRYLSLFLMFCILFTNIPLSSNADCLHENTELAYSPEYSYDYYNDTYHNTYVTLHYRCQNCGELITNNEDYGLQEHSNSGGSCNECGASMVCMHENTELVYSPEYSYDYYNDTYHNTYVTLHYRCQNCGELITNNENYGLQEHSNNGGSCNECGASMVCLHENTELVYSPEYSYDYYNDTYHNTYVTLHYRCQNCGETITNNENYGLQEHSNNGGSCNECGASMVCLHENTELKYAPEYEYIYMDKYYHITNVFLNYTCKNCGNDVIIKEEHGIQEHFYNSGVCGCGAKEGTVIPEPTPTSVATEIPTQDIPIETPIKISTATPIATSTPTVTNTEDIPKKDIICTYTRPEIDEKYEYYDTSSHLKYHNEVSECTLCGKVKEKNVGIIKENHVFENNVCVLCKWKNENAKDIELEIQELIEIANTALALKNNKKITDYEFDNIMKQIQKELEKCDALRKNKKVLTEKDSWKKQSSLLSIWEKRGKYSLSVPTLIPNEDFVKINVAEPDNKWYYITGEDGEQILLGNFSDKVTIKGVAGQLIVGEIPVIGTVADARDVIADLVNWEWSMQHFGTTALDVIGLAPFVGAVKYVDEASILAKGVKLSDEASEVLTTTVKHLDDVNNTGKHSDELAEAVGEAVTKHFDETESVLNSAQIVSNASSKVLRRNMISAGVKVPDYPHAAHHIVAGTSPKAQEAREILKKYGVDINDATNGVFLPAQKGVAEGAYHPSLHTNKYYEEINNMLSLAKSKEDVTDILNDIAEDLINGTFMK